MVNLFLLSFLRQMIIHQDVRTLNLVKSQVVSLLKTDV